MLIAKYVKVFPRTGTLPSLLGCRFLLDFGPSTPRRWEQFLAHWYYHDVSTRILPIINTLDALAYSHGNHALLDNDPGVGKSLDILSSRRQAFPCLPEKGKETARKYTAANGGLPRVVSGRLAPARVT